MKKISLVLLFAIATTLATAQSLSPIVGVVIDQSDLATLPSVAIRLLHDTDSTLSKGTTTDEQGRFVLIPPKQGDYILRFDFLGYQTLYRNLTIGATTKHQLDTIALSPSTQLLQDVKVEAKRVAVIVKGDTVAYNADAYAVPQSAMLEDLLEKIPGMEIDEEGKITINGKEVKNILVDGEDFFANDPKVATKNLPAQMVEKLQVFDQKSDMAQMTGFDDGEEETVINLVIRPSMKEGLFGNAFAGYGSKNRYEGNLMVNYMKNKNQYTFVGGVNNTNNAGFTDLSAAMFGNMGGQGRRTRPPQQQTGVSHTGSYGFNFFNSPTTTLDIGGDIRIGHTDKQINRDEWTQNRLKSGDTFEKENNKANNRSQNLHLNMSITYQPSKNTTLLFSPNISYYTHQKEEWGVFETHSHTQQPLNNGNSSYTSQGMGNKIGGQLDISHKIGHRGSTISLQLISNRQQINNQGINQSYTHYLNQPDDQIDQHIVHKEREQQHTAYLSYVEPINKHHFIQLAYRYSRQYALSEKNTKTKDLDGQYTLLDKTYSRWMDNQFDTQNVQLNYKNVGKKYDYTIGVSLHPAHSYSYAYIGDSTLHRLNLQTTNYAPTAQLNYRWSKSQHLKIDYKGRTKQPTIQQLTPVIDLTDPLNATYGNPNLKPSFEHRLRIRYQHYNPQKQTIFLTFVNAAYLIDDVVSSINTDANTGKKITTYQNQTGNHLLNGRVIINQPIKKTPLSLSSMSYIGYTYHQGWTEKEHFANRQLQLYEVLGVAYKSELLDAHIKGNLRYNRVMNSLYSTQTQHYLNWGMALTTQLHLPYDISVASEITQNSNAGYATGFAQNEWLWNATLQKQILPQKNATLRLKIYDILQQRNHISRVVSDNYIKDITTNSLTTYFILHFVYRFSQFGEGTTQDDMQLNRKKRPRGR